MILTMEEGNLRWFFKATKQTRFGEAGGGGCWIVRDVDPSPAYVNESFDAILAQYKVDMEADASEFLIGYGEGFDDGKALYPQTDELGAAAIEYLRGEAISKRAAGALRALGAAIEQGDNPPLRHAEPLAAMGEPTVNK